MPRIQPQMLFLFSGTPLVVGLFCFYIRSLSFYIRSLLTVVCKPQEGNTHSFKYTTHTHIIQMHTQIPPNHTHALSLTRTL